MKIIYSFNKSGHEGKCWESEILAAANDEVSFIPFNHGVYLNPDLYDDSVKLDRLYQARDERLFRMYGDLELLINQHQIHSLFVTNCPPYHPEFLRKLPVYKILHTTDDPGATYMRTIPYLHSYQHVMYGGQGYSPDMNLEEKMRYCGMANVDWLPLAAMDFECDPLQSDDRILAHERDLDIVYIGSFFRQKLDLLFKVKKAFRREFHIYGRFLPRHNLYVNFRYGFPGWIRSVTFEERVRLYQRAKIGINIHWNDFGLGNQRLYHLPANGVMQLCDCARDLNQVFRDGEEVVGYRSADDLIEKIRYYLKHDKERREIAIRGYRRAMQDYRFTKVTQSLGPLIRRGMRRLSYSVRGELCVKMQA
jgi:spore maturation protein CgeB